MTNLPTDESNDRPDAADRTDAADRPDAGDRTDAADRPDAADRTDAADRPDAGDGFEAGDETDTGDAFDADEFDLADLPDGVDREAVERMRAVARILDESLRVPGTQFRIGLDPVVGLIPGVGDAISAGISAYIVLEAARLGVSYTTVVRMLANVAVDAAVGSVPVVGTLFDAVWKTNRWNLELALADLTSAAEPNAAASPDADDEADVIQIEID